MTIFSPNTAGRVETRKSYGLPSMVAEMRPSWGARFSAMSMSAMILMRDVMDACAFLGSVMPSCRMPSTR